MEEIRDKVENFMNQIFKDEKVYDESGKEHKLNANLSIEEGLEIVKIINENPKFSFYETTLYDYLGVLALIFRMYFFYPVRKT